MENSINSISLKKSDGKAVSIMGVVDRVMQTSGPTLFSVGDGTGTLVLKGFEGPGVRAYPMINEGDVIRASARIKEFQGSLEGEINKIQKLQGDEAKRVKSSIESIERKSAEITPPQFLIKSGILDKLRDSFIKAAVEIRYAIIKSRPIIVRHHNDCDGYSAGYSLERAILPLIIKQHGGGKAPWEFYTRAPCAAPFYEIEDSIKDAAHSLADAAKFSNKMPLVVIVDNGSGAEDLMGIKQGKIHGMDFIVVDHHYFEKDLISPEVLAHINPFLVGEDGRTFSAGMLCSELARFINPESSAVSAYIPALNNPDAMNAYLKLAEKKGYSKELLYDLAALIDFISTKLRFMEAREYIEVTFGDPVEKQKALVNLIVPHIRMLEKRGITIAQSAVKREKIGATVLQVLSIEDSFSRGAYPKPGKVVGLIHDNLQEKGEKNVVTIGLLSDAITIRATEESKFSVHDFLAYLQNNVPETFAEGGGHHQAGALKFVPLEQKKVMDALRLFLSGKK